MSDQKNLVTQEDIGGPDFSRLDSLGGMNVGTDRVRRVSDQGLFRGKLSGNYEQYVPERHHAEYFAASNQSGMELVGNALGQFTAEMGLGILEGAGYLLDLENYVMAFREGEKEFDNWFSSLMKEGKEYVNEELLPIHDSPDSEGFNPLNGRWWAKNFAQFGSAVSILVPATGAAKAVQYAGKTLNLANKGNKLAKTLASTGKIGSSFAQGTAAAMVSRQTESLMEANQVYEQAIGEGKDPLEAGEAAAKNYRDNLALLAVDIVQYSTLLGGGKKAMQKMFSRSKDSQKSLVREGLEQMVPEAGEEVYQFLSAEEAQKVASGEVSAGFIFGKGFEERLSDYLRDEELHTAALLGAVGGFAMPTAIQGISKVYDRILNGKAQEYQTNIDFLESNDQDVEAQDEKNKLFLSEMFRHASDGRITDLENAITAKLEEAQAAGNEAGVKEYKRYLEDIPKFEEIFNRIQNRPGYARQGNFEHISDNHTALKTEHILTAWEMKRFTDAGSDIDTKINELFESVTENELDPGLAEIKQLTVLKEVYDSEMGQVLIPNKTKRAERLSEINSKLDNLKETNPLTQGRTNINELLATSQDANIDAALIARERINLGKTDTKAKLGKFGTALGQEEILKGISKQTGESKKRLEEFWSQFIGEGVVISNKEKDYDIISNGDKFIVRQYGDPDIEGGASNEISSGEYAIFEEKNKVSDQRLISIFNKQKNGKSLNDREQKIADAKQTELATLRSSTQFNNKGEGFTRAELVEWMRKNNYEIKDDTQYQNRLEKDATAEERRLTRMRLSDNKIDLAENQEYYEVLQNSLNNTIQDISTLQEMEQLQKDIQKSRDLINANNRKLAALNQPTRLDQVDFYSRATKLRSAATKFYEEKVNKLIEEKEGLEKTTASLKQDAITLREILQDIKRDFRSGKVGARQHYADLKEVNNDLAEIESNLNGATERITNIDEEVSRYNETLQDVKGENVILRKQQVEEMLNGAGEKAGLKYLVAEAKRVRDKMQSKLDDIIDDLLRLYDVPQDKINDEAFISKMLTAAEKLGDEEIKEWAKEPRKKKILSDQLNEIVKDINEASELITTLERELKDIEAIEAIAFISKIPKTKDSKGKKEIQKIVEEEEVEFVSKKSAVEFFNFLRGSHFPGGTINPDAHERRYFKFVENNSISGGNYFIQLVPYNIQGKATNHSVLLPDRVLNKMSEEQLDNMIFAVITDKNGKPIGLDGNALESSDWATIANSGIYTMFPDGSTTGQYGENYKGTKEEIQASKKKFMEVRDNIMDNLQEGRKVYLHAASKSVGIPIKDTRKPAALTARKPNVVINTSGYFDYQKRNIGVKPGTVHIRDGISGQVNQVYPRTLRDDEIGTIKQALQLALDNAGKVKNPFDVEVLKGKTIRDVLESYVYMGPPSKKNKGGYLFERIDKDGTFTGTMHLDQMGDVSLKELLKSDDTLTRWLEDRYHQVNNTYLGQKGSYVKIFWDGDSFNTKSYPSYQYYLLDADLSVLESTLPEYSDDIDNPQKMNTNIYFDYDNIGIDELPNEEKSKVKARKAKAKKTTRSKKKTKKANKGKATPGMVNLPNLGELRNELLDDDTVGDLGAATGSPKKIKKEVGKKLFGGAARGREPYNKDRSATLTNGKYVLENMDKAEEWFKANFPQVPFKVVVGLHKSGAWGRFTRYGEVLLDPYAEEGTIYHEAFHAALGLFHTRQDQDIIFDQYRKIIGKNLPNNEVEELLAEDFRDYMLTGVLPEHLKSEPKTFIQRFLDFIRWIVGLNEPSIEQIFKNISNGHYAKLTPDFSRLREDKNRSFEGKDVKFTVNAIQGVDYLFWEDVPDGELVDQILSDTVPKDQVKQLYDNVIVKIQDQITYYEELLDTLEEDDPALATAIEMIDARQFIIDNFFSSNGPSVIDLHREHLATINVTLEELDIPEEEMNRDPDNQWDEVSLETNPKRTASNDVKLFLSTIPKAIRISGEDYKDFNDLEFNYFEDFAKVFALISNELANTQTLTEMDGAIENLRKVWPGSRLVKEKFYLGIDMSKLSGTQAGRKLRFFQAFSKYKNNYFTEVIDRNGDHLFIKSSTANFRSKLKNEWENNFTAKLTSQAEAAVEGDLSDWTIYSAMKQANRMGLYFENWKYLTPDNQAAAMSNILYISTAIYEGRDPFTTEIGNLNSLLEMAYTVSPDSITNSHSGINGKTKYDNSQYSYYSSVNNTLNKLAQDIKERGLTEEQGLDLIFGTLPDLDNIYSRDSKVLRLYARGEVRESGILEGMNSSSSSAREFSRLHFQDNFLSQFNNVIEGKYHMVRPSDNKLERIFDWGLFMKPEEIEGTTSGRINPVNMLLDYLKSEVELIKDANIDNPQIYQKYKNLGNNLKQTYQGTTLDPTSMATAGILVSAIANKQTAQLLDQYMFEDIGIEDFLYHPAVVDGMNNWFRDQTAVVLRSMDDTNITGDNIEKMLRSYKDLDQGTLAEFFLINYILGNIEQTKIFTGHPSMYKRVEDFIKRMSGMVGTKSKPNIDRETNDFLKEKLHTRSEPIVKTAVVADIKVTSEFADEYEQILKDRFKDKSTAALKVDEFYRAMDEADAMGLISLDEYRVFKFRVGDWDWKQEMTYQWEVQGGWQGNTVTAPTNSPYSEIAGKKITQFDIERDHYFLPSLKPQYFGPLANEETFVTGYYKLALTPILPSMANNRNMKVIADKMKSQGIGILTFDSGSKVVSKLGDYNDPNIAGLQSIYDSEGEIISGKLKTQDTYYEHWGIQVQNRPVQKTKASSGTQFLKQIESNLTVEGVPKDVDISSRVWSRMTHAEKKGASPLYNKIERLRKLNSTRQELGVTNLKNRLGLKETELDGEKYYLVEGDSIGEVKKYLQQQFAARDLPQNMINSVRWIEFGIDFLVNREKVENILMSIADRMTVSQKRLGKNSVQVSSTFFEEIKARNFRKVDGKRVYSSSNLKFYTKKDGKISEMEILLPHYFKEMWGEDVDINEIDNDLLSIIGFRIPTQGLNSIESIKIKGFLPQGLGDMVVVPSEIVAKTGSDFDFDKMFLHFPNYEMIDGKPKYIAWSNSPSKIWNRRKKRFTESIPELKKELNNIREKYKNDGELLDMQVELVYEKGYKEFDQLDLFAKNGTAAIENEIMRIHKEFLSDINRFDELINPISVTLFKNEAKALNRLRGLSEDSKGLSSLVDPVYMIRKSVELQQAKQNVGRSALNATSHILFSQIGAYLKLSDKQRIYLPVNKIQIGGKEVPSLSSAKNQDGIYITDLLSEMINTYVDAANDPFMFSINAGPDGINVFSLLVRLGTPLSHIVYFMNQPIIIEYMNKRRANSSMYFYETRNTDWRYEEKLRKKYTPSSRPSGGYAGLKSLTKLSSTIEKYYKDGESNENFTNEQKSLQLAALNQFKLLENLSKGVRDAIWGLSYDTAAGGKNTAQMMHRLMLTEMVKADGVVGNYERLFEPGQFVHPFYNSVKDTQAMFKSMMVHLKNDSAYYQFERMTKLNMNEFEKEKVIDVFKADFMTYLVQSRTLRDPKIARLIYSYDNPKRKVKNIQSVPYRISQYQKRIDKGLEEPNELIEALSVHLNNYDRVTKQYVDNLSLNSGSKKDSFESDVYTEAWERLRETSDILAKDLGRFIWLQSGLQNSPINFIDIMPEDIYGTIMLEALEGLDDLDTNLSFDNFYHEFFLNNLSAPFWKTRGSLKGIKGDWPAYRILGREFGEGTRYFFKNPKSSKFQRVNMNRVRSVRNFRKNSTRKAYFNKPLNYYTTFTTNSPTVPKSDEVRDSFVDGLDLRNCD